MSTSGFLTLIAFFTAIILETTNALSASVAVPEAKETIRLSWETGVEGAIRDACRAMKGTLDRPLMVSVTGIPGSGKSTSARILTQGLSDVGCVTMPHDGYHIPKQDLMSLPDSIDKLYRRGAPDTFDPRSLLRDLRRIRDGNERAVKIPGFDHARGDPDLNAHTFSRDQHRVVICEGLYLLHSDDGWNGVKNMFDLSIFVDADLDACMDRLKIRNLCIPGYTPDEIVQRVDAVDRVNAETVILSRSRATIVVQSVA